MSEIGKTAVVLVNTGTPDAPTTKAVRQYLAEFLSDSRIIELPKWKWWPILHGIILRTRPAKSAQRYQMIWDDRVGSPLMKYGLQLQKDLTKAFARKNYSFHLAMRYGQPSIRSVLNELNLAKVQRVCILPLFPQFAPQTTMSVYDEVFSYYQKSRCMPRLICVRDYHLHPVYIEMLAQQIEQHWQQYGKPRYGIKAKLVLSFHGIPQRCVEKGDLYQQYCKETAQLLRQRLGLLERQAPITFQSRFGKQEWLQPYTEPSVRQWGERGVQRLDVIAPGFAMDCLETIEELDDRVRRAYQSVSKDGRYHYIPALNASEKALQLYTNIVNDYLGK